MYRRYLGVSAVALAGFLALAWNGMAQEKQEKKEGSSSGQQREAASAAPHREGSSSPQQRHGSTATEPRREGEVRPGTEIRSNGEIRSGTEMRSGEVRSGGYYSGPFYDGGRWYGRGYYYGPGYSGFGWRPRSYGYGYYDNGSYYGDGYYGDGSYSSRPRRFFGRGSYDYSYGFEGPASYYSNGSTPYASPDCDSSYGSTGKGYAYGAMDPNSALINVKVGAADAQLFFDNAPTQQTGEMRQFVTPPLEQGKNFAYMLHARWKQGDRDMDDTRKVTVHAGERLSVDFTSRQEEGAGKGPEGAPQPKLGDNGAPPPAPEGFQPPLQGGQANLDVHEGQFLSFHEGTLEMSDIQGKKHSHHLAPDAQIIINGQPAKPDDLKADMKLKITTKTGDPQTVTKIEVKSQGKRPNGNQDNKRPLDQGAPPPQPQGQGAPPPQPNKL